VDKKDKIKKSVPSYFKPEVNIYWKNFLESIAEEDNRVITQIDEAKKQIFVETASGSYLDALGDNVSVFKPLELNLSDDKYRELIKFLSFYPKQVKSLILEVLDVFYGETYSRFSSQTINNAPYNLTGGECLVYKTESTPIQSNTKSLTADGETDGANTIRVVSTSGMYIGQVVSVSDDDSSELVATVTGVTKTVATLDTSTASFTLSQNAFVIFNTYHSVVFESGDFAISGAATALEVAAAINTVAINSTATSVSSDTQVNIRTNVAGNKGSIQVLGGSANVALNFPTTEPTSLRVQVSEINPNEIVIRVPATIPALRRILQGSAHLHGDSTLVPPWVGSFVYDTDIDYTVTKVSTTLNQTIQAGLVYTQISVIDSSDLPNSAGFLMFDFGKNNIEYSVPYIGRPNNSTLLLDPGYTFTKDHSAGEIINIILNEPTIPRAGGGDYPVYVAGSSPSTRAEVQAIVESIIATGIVIRWQINYPVCGKI